MWKYNKLLMRYTDVRIWLSQTSNYFLKSYFCQQYFDGSGQLADNSKLSSIKQQDFSTALLSFMCRGKKKRPRQRSVLKGKKTDLHSNLTP